VRIKDILRDILEFLMPRKCVMCGERLRGGESFICGHCFVHLPFTYYHLVEQSQLEKQFWALFPIERATSMFYHDGKNTRNIIYQIKYNGNPEVGRHMAYLYAEELEKCHYFDDIDMLIPLPLHWKRQLKRHYNQSHYICQGIHEKTGIPVEKGVVKRIKNNISQTHLNATQRLSNVEGIFQVTHPEKIKGKHVLLVDDVVTTGATLSSCAKELAKVPDVKVSILTLSVASRTAAPVLEEDNIDVSIYGIPLME